MKAPDVNKELELKSRYGMQLEEFSALMEHRIRDILIVASPYSAFILEEDGQLTELIFEEYRNLDLNMRYVPRFHRASSATEALAMLESHRVDLLVTTARIGDMSVSEFVGEAKRRKDIPVSALAAHAWELPELLGLADSGLADFVFLWQGDVKVLLAMVKQIEDRLNAPHDILDGGVQVIVVVEDEVRYYSVFLPLVYTEVTTQTARLMGEGLNLPHRLLRIRARPKILLARNYEEAIDFLDQYGGSLLGLISDVSFPKNGKMDDAAGPALVEHVRRLHKDVPVLLQSTESRHADLSDRLGVSFLSKQSSNLLEEIRRFMIEHFGFGDFLFRMPDGTEVARAKDLRSLVQVLETVPDESIEFHATRNHFSAWLKARCEFELASMIRPVGIEAFRSISELRHHLIVVFTSYLREVQRHIIVDFDRERFDQFVIFSRIGQGSLGGKGRGLAFVNKLLAQDPVDLPGVHVTIPQTVVLSSEVFEEFLEKNSLQDFPSIAQGMEDGEILDALRRGRFPRSLRADLAALLRRIGEPLAVRSSSILEDSLYQPFAGVYATVMLPNSHPSLDVRLAQLLEAIKVVYASTYYKAARDYLGTTPHRVEEERMAVLIQRLVGSRRGTRFYPSFSGVASSYNFYPFGGVRPEDGVALVAAGLGKSIVDGFEALRFSPAYPKILPQFSSVKDILDNAQRKFYALDLDRSDLIPGKDVDASLLRLSTVEAVRDGAADQMVSTYLPDNDAITTGFRKGGSPLITFDPILKGRAFPLAEQLGKLLELSQRGFGTPVEIEFAVDFQRPLRDPQPFHVLQVRPMVSARSVQEISITAEDVEQSLVYSKQTLGHGHSGEIHDVIFIDPESFPRNKTEYAVQVIQDINDALREEGRHSLLIGPGRWGSRDPWLGIPVDWSQISMARAIVEADFSDLQVEPSQGSHFFHNLTCFGVAYFHAHQRASAKIDLEWFRGRRALRSELDGSIRWLRLDRALEAKVDGAKGVGVVLERRPQIASLEISS